MKVQLGFIMTIGILIQQLHSSLDEHWFLLHVTPSCIMLCEGNAGFVLFMLSVVSLCCQQG